LDTGMFEWETRLAADKDYNLAQADLPSKTKIN